MKRLSIKTIALFIAVFSCLSLHAQNIGDNIQMRWQLLDNDYQGQKKSLTQLSILNRSDLTIPNEDWSLFSAACAHWMWRV